MTTKKRHWGRWILLSLGLVVLLAVGGHRWWGVRAGRALTKQIAAYRAAGEPMTRTDLKPMGVVEGPNAVTDLRAAAGMIDPDEKFFDRSDQSDADLMKNAESHAKIQKLLHKYRPALERAAAATTKPGVDWGLKFNQPIQLMDLPDLGQQYKLAHVVGWDVLEAHAGKDDRRALRDVRTLLFQSRAINHQPLLVPHLVALGITAVTTKNLESITPDLRIGQDEGAATPRHVQQIVNDLLDTKLFQPALLNALRSERVLLLDFARGLLTGNPELFPPGIKKTGWYGVKMYVMRPRVLDDEYLVNRHSQRLISAAKSTSWPAFEKAQPPLPPLMKNVSRRHLIARLAAIFLPGKIKAIKRHFMALTERRLAATALTIRWYATEHDGQLPAILADLVPKYLPVVPDDPFTTGQPLHYDPNRQILWSVGGNEMDDGGDEAWLPKRVQVDRNLHGEWGRHDRVVHLKPEK